MAAGHQHSIVHLIHTMTFKHCVIQLQ